MQFFFNIKNAVVQGSFKIDWIPPFTGLAVMITCFICYYVAVSKGEVKPFPYCTITATGEKYP